MGLEPVLGRELFEVVEDLWLRRVGARPVVLALEREGVEVRGDVARRTGIRVVPPSSADAVGLLENHEVVEARLAQLGAHAESARPGPDHHDPTRARHPRLSRQVADIFASVVTVFQLRVVAIVEN